MIKYILIFCILTMTSFCMEEKDITWINGTAIGKVKAEILTGYAQKAEGDSRITCYVRYLNTQSEEDAYRTLVSFNSGFIDLQNGSAYSKKRYKELEFQYKNQINELSDSKQTFIFSKL